MFYYVLMFLVNRKDFQLVIVNTLVLGSIFIFIFVNGKLFFFDVFLLFQRSRFFLVLNLMYFLSGLGCLGEEGLWNGREVLRDGDIRRQGVFYQGVEDNIFLVKFFVYWMELY